jgi:hypothetical protein
VRYSPFLQTCPFAAECAPDLVESINWDKDCRVCRGYNRVLVIFSYSHFPTMHLQPLARYFYAYNSNFTLCAGERPGLNIPPVCFWPFFIHTQGKEWKVAGSLSEVNRHFRGSQNFHLQDRRISQAWNSRQYFLPKRPLATLRHPRGYY